MWYSKDRSINWYNLSGKQLDIMYQELEKFIFFHTAIFLVYLKDINIDVSKDLVMLSII